jgi:phage shock protein C
MAGSTKRLYRDKDRGKIAGVCAGIADYFGWDIAVVRVICVVLAFVQAPAVIGVYILMAWLVDAKPSGRFGTGGYASSSYSTSDAAPVRPRFTDVKARFDRLEGRMRALETVVTSREYQIDRELRSTGRS